MLAQSSGEEESSGHSVQAEVNAVEQLASERVLGSVLELVRRVWGPYELLKHHQQGEFHHDIFIRIPLAKPALPGEYIVISTNCNGGVKEIVCFGECVDPVALWHDRCPDNPEFHGAIPPLLATARTEHWFDPCELLSANARSELKAEFRERQLGGGWCKKT